MGRHLDSVDVEEVVTRYAQGESCTALGLAFGVCSDTIRDRLRASGVVVRRAGRYSSRGGDPVVYDEMAFTGTWERHGLIEVPVNR